MKQYSVVVIGCGHIGQQHLADIYYRSQIKIAGVVDTNKALAEECCKKYNAGSYGTDYRPYLSDAKVDIIIIATYTDTHYQILKDALAHNKHIICEKPIAKTLSEGEAFVRLVKNAKTHVLISHILRHNNTYCRAAQLINSGLIGKIMVMRMVQNHHCINWARYKRLLNDCTPILDCGVHYFDVMQWFTGSKITKVNAYGVKIDNDLPTGCVNYCIANVQLSCGAIAYYEAGWSPSLPSSNIKEFIGENGSMQIILNRHRAADVEEGDLIKVFINKTHEYKTINVQSEYRNMWGQISHLIAMIEHNKLAWPNIDDVFSAFKIAVCAQEQILSQNT